MDFETEKVIIGKTEDGETLVFIKSVSILFILDSVHYPFHAVGGILAHFIYNKLAIMKNSEFCLRDNPGLVTFLKGFLAKAYHQIDKTHQEFTESYANFEIWMEDFETSVEKIEHVREVEKDSTVPPSHQTSQ